LFFGSRFGSFVRRSTSSLCRSSIRYTRCADPARSSRSAASISFRPWMLEPRRGAARRVARAEVRRIGHAGHAARRSRDELHALRGMRRALPKAMILQSATILVFLFTSSRAPSTRPKSSRRAHRSGRCSNLDGTWGASPQAAERPSTGRLSGKSSIRALEERRRAFNSRMPLETSRSRFAMSTSRSEAQALRSREHRSHRDVRRADERYHRRRCIGH